MNKKTSHISLVALLLLLFSTPNWAQEVEKPVHDLSGRWKVLLSNSLSRKQVTFNIQEKDNRLRGTVSGRTIGELKLDGRREKNQVIRLWGTYYERTGRSWDYEFKGKFEGEPGQEQLVGEADFFRRRYDFVGKRSKKKKKKRRRG